jgi:hypothetical protein
MNKPFHAFVQEEWIKWMEVPDHNLTPKGQMKFQTISQVFELANICGSLGTIVKYFKKGSIRNFLDGMEEDGERGK